MILQQRNIPVTMVGPCVSYYGGQKKTDACACKQTSLALSVRKGQKEATEEKEPRKDQVYFITGLILPTFTGRLKKQRFLSLFD